MPSPDDPGAGSDCRWITLGQAFRHFALYAGSVQSQRHIKALHWHVACRLVLEGGFHPDDITPRPPFTVASRRGGHALVLDPSRAGRGERTVLGGLKTKNVDVVVTKEGLGPVMAVSCKGTGGAFRNLTNRIEEAVGDCTNLPSPIRQWSWASWPSCARTGVRRRPPLPWRRVPRPGGRWRPTT